MKKSAAYKMQACKWHKAKSVINVSRCVGGVYYVMTWHGIEDFDTGDDGDVMKIIGQKRERIINTVKVTHPWHHNIIILHAHAVALF